MTFIDVSAFGALGTGGDDTAAFEAACLAANPGDRIHVGPGRFGLSRTLYPPCVIEGGDPINSVIFALPEAQQPLIDIRDKTGAGVYSLGLEGNNTYSGTGSSTVGAISQGGNTAPVFNNRIHNCRFSKFKADYWVLGFSATMSQGPSIIGNAFITRPEDVRNTQDYLVALYGDMSGYMFDTIIQRNTIDGEGVNNGICLFGGHRRFDISHNMINNMGTANTVTDIGYGVLVYAMGSTYAEAATKCPAQGNISNNIITNATKAGIYAATAFALTIDSNSVFGQSCAEDVSLPRGGIALVGCGNVSTTNNNLQDCYWGVSVAGEYSYDHFISGNRIKSGRGGSPVGVKLSAALAVDRRMTVTNNDVWLLSGGGRAFHHLMSGGDITIRNNSSRAAVHGLTDEHTFHREIGNNAFFPI